MIHSDFNKFWILNDTYNKKRVIYWGKKGHKILPNFKCRQHSTYMTLKIFIMILKHIGNRDNLKISRRYEMGDIYHFGKLCEKLCYFMKFFKIYGI